MVEMEEALPPVQQGACAAQGEGAREVCPPEKRFASTAPRYLALIRIPTILIA